MGVWVMISAIQAELTNLAGEARKKSPAVKEAAERALLKLRSVDEGKISPDAVVAEVAKAEEVVRACCLTSDSKNSKLISVAISCIQKLVAHGALCETSVAMVIALLRSQAESGEEQTQLRILQTSLGLVTTNWIEASDPVNQALEICFRLHAGKSTMVSHTAAATIRQMTSLIFDRVESLDGSESDSKARASAVQIAVWYFKDVVALTAGKYNMWSCTPSTMY